MGKDFKQSLKAVKQSYARCCDREDFYRIFYNLLILQSDEIAAMFAGSDFKKQKYVINSAIRNSILYAENPKAPFIKNRINKTAKLYSRKGLNVRPDLYHICIDSLILTLSKVDPGFSAETARDWREILEPVINFMVLKYDK